MIAHVRSLITTAGAPIFGGLANDALGYPMVNTEVMATRAAATGTVFGIFGDLRRGLAMGERGSMTMKLGEEGTVGANNLFEKDLVALRVIERVAMGVLLPSSVLKLKG